jgi:hypothetical protein
MSDFQFSPPGKVCILSYRTEAPALDHPGFVPDLREASLFQLPPRPPNASVAFASHPHSVFLGNIALSETMLADHLTACIDRSLATFLGASDGGFTDFPRRNDWLHGSPRS